MESGKILAAEALARLYHKGTLVPPAEFIPIFEQNGAIIQLDYYVLEQVCQYLHRRQQQGKALFPISVNLSRLHITDPHTVQKIHSIVQRYGLSPALLCFELTESIILDDFNGVIRLNRELQELGYSTSVDDFGSGYTGLNILQQIPVTEIKFDRSFLADEPSLRQRNTHILSALSQLAEKLHIRVICEGVETRDQQELLQSMGLRFAQGFYFARPCDPDSL